MLERHVLSALARANSKNAVHHWLGRYNAQQTHVGVLDALHSCRQIETALSH